MQFTIKHDFDTTIKALTGMEKQVIFATAEALTKTAKDIESAEYREIRDVYDKPTALTMNSLFVKPATRSRLNAVVMIKDMIGGGGTPAAKYLDPTIRGGVRSLKKYEVALRSVGVLPEGYYTVPGAGADIDAFGNMKRSQIIQLLSYFRTFGTAGYSANMTEQSRKRFERKQGRRVSAASAQFFVGSPGDGKLPLGIWQRFQFSGGTAIKPILIFVKWNSYEKLFDFRYVAERTIERYWKTNFNNSLANAMRSAR
jgi:hypothetical protein